MPSKRRRSSASQADSDSPKNRSGKTSSKKPVRQKQTRHDNAAEPFSINLDQADLQNWLAEAEGLLWGSSGRTDPDAAIAQARKTLAKSPDDVDAYLTLAEHADSDRLALPLFEKAVAAGERGIGRSRFEKLVGEFWLDPKTRPYMQARMSLARSLWTLSRRDEAVSHFQELLRLNPNDNQGVRYVLLNSLIALGRFDDAKVLIQRYDEPSAAWAFSKVLVAFHEGGDAAASRTALKEARRINKHVVPFLLGEKEPPDDNPGFYSPGDKYEACFYIEESLGTWKQVPGAVTWLSTVMSAGSKARKNRDQPATSRRKPAAPRATGPTPRGKQSLRKLPLNYGTIWQVTVERFQHPDGIATGELASWMILGVNLQSGQLIVQDVVETPPSAELIWDRLTDAMENPADGSPGRPAEIQTRTDATWQALEPHLQEIEVDVINRPQLDQLDQLVSQLNQHLEASAAAGGLLDNDNLAPDNIGRLYAAAAEFYRRQPWNFVPMDAPLRVEGTAVGDQPRYCLVMGQSAMTFGLSIYQSLDQIRSMLDNRCGGCDDECDADDCGEGECGGCDVGGCSQSEIDLTPLGSSLAVVFDTSEGMTQGDLAAIQQYGWPVAGPEAYPAIYRTAAQLTPEPPTAADLRLLAACLIAIPGFASRHPFDRGGSPCEEFSFSDCDRPLTLSVSWVREDDEEDA